MENLGRPGGNATGFTIMEPTIIGKLLELLKEIAPRVNRAAFLFNPATSPYRDVYLNPFKTAAPSLAVEAILAPVHDVSELESVIAAQGRDPNGSLIVMPDGFLNVHREEIVSLAARYRMPAVYPWRFFAELGGLLSYGSDQRDMFRVAATYVDRILKGEKPADLPVQAPTKYELVINLKTAKALGLDVPWFLQQRADGGRSWCRKNWAGDSTQPRQNNSPAARARPPGGASYGASRCVLHQGEYLALANWVPIPPTVGTRPRDPCISLN